MRCGLLSLAALFLITSVLWGAKESGCRTDRRMRRELARQAVSIAAAISIDEVLELSFAIHDLNRPEYHRLCDMLKAYPSLYIEPMVGHENAIGYNAYSEALRRTALDEAIQTGHAPATATVNLIALPDAPPRDFYFPAGLRSNTKRCRLFRDPPGPAVSTADATEHCRIHRSVNLSAGTDAEKQTG